MITEYILKPVVSFGDGYPPSNVKEFITWLHDKLNATPEQYRDVLEIAFNVCHIYDMEEVEASVSYEREMAEEELAANKLRDEQEVAKQIAYLLARLKQLEAQQQNTFGNPANCKTKGV